MAFADELETNLAEMLTENVENCSREKELKRWDTSKICLQRKPIFQKIFQIFFEQKKRINFL